jgi:ribosomal-protein-alanine N-acetyltransferase
MSTVFNFGIEQMRVMHIPAVVALEQECHLNSRGESSYRKALQDSNSILLVATAELPMPLSLKVIACFSAQMVIDELQIDNIAVAENYRQKGVATSLLAEALKTAKEKGMNSAVLEVRAKNSAALKLYEQQGFIVAGCRKDYYHAPPDDALTMLLNASKHA